MSLLEPRVLFVNNVNLFVRDHEKSVMGPIELIELLNFTQPGARPETLSYPESDTSHTKWVTIAVRSQGRLFVVVSTQMSICSQFTVLFPDEQQRCSEHAVVSDLVSK